MGANDVDNVAFANADDGSVALIVVNSAAEPRTVSIAQSGRTLRYALAPKSIHTFVWPG